MEGFTILDSENSAPISDKPRVEKVTRASCGSVARKKLADISNLPQQQPRNSTQDEKALFSSSSTKEYIEQLQKENMALMKMLADRNKIIELTTTELQKLRVNFQKMQQQNLQLAQSNSQMLGELNLGKDRLKALQHELGCKNGLLKVKLLEKEVKLTKSEHPGELTEDPGELNVEGRDDNKQNRVKRKVNSKSLGPSRQVQSKDKAGNKRACVRRQSARFKSEERECSEDVPAIDDSKLSVCPPTTDSVLENDSACMSATMRDEAKEENPASSHEAGECGRLSLGRPSRRAAKKVQSYKEIPLNVKMRRTE